MKTLYCFLGGIILFGGFNPAVAQVKSDLFSVHFNVDEHILDELDQQVLDKLISTINGSAYFEIELQGHTDSDAGNTYNKQLSKRRVNSVREYLIGKGIASGRIITKYWGEDKPLNKNLDLSEKAANRRVELSLKQYYFQDAAGLIDCIKPNDTQSFTINPGQEVIITGKSGTKVQIPANSLVYPDGRPVKEPVTLQLKEVTKPSEALFNKLSTTSNGQVLESGGMFDIRTFANNTELKLKKGASVKVDLPSASLQEGMMLFTPVENNSGVTEWAQSSLGFVPQSRVKSTGIRKINPIELRKAYLPQLERVRWINEFSFNAPEAPRRPRRPLSLPDYREPTAKDVFTRFERIILPSWIKEKRLLNEQEKARELYNKWQNKHARRLEKYYLDLAAFRLDSARYFNEITDSCSSWLNSQKAYFESFLMYAYTESWNLALSDLIRLNENFQLPFWNLYAQFSIRFNTYRTREFRTHRAENMLAQCNRLLKVPKHLMFEKLLESRKIVLRPGVQDNQRETGILMTFYESAPESILASAINSRFYDQNQGDQLTFNLPGIYSITLEGFGLFNCDKFLRPEAQLVKCRVICPSQSRVFAYLPETNSMIYFNYSDGGFELKVPLGEKVKLLVLSVSANQDPLIAVEDRVLLSDTELTPRLQAASIEKMEQMISSL